MAKGSKSGAATTPTAKGPTAAQLRDAVLHLARVTKSEPEVTRLLGERPADEPAPES